MREKLRNFVTEAGLIITFFTAISVLTIAYVTLAQAWLAISNWPPISQRLASLH